MCVILISNPTKPRISASMIQQADLANRDGIGVAWLDNDKVCWQKGLTVETAIVLAANLPQPYMFHFRMATIGAVSPELTHPFPLFGDVTDALKGRTHHGVMMHNGHWSGWEKEFKKRASARWIHRYITDKAAWSDSRGMAWLASRIGYHVLPKIAKAGQRIAVMTTRGVKTYGEGWCDIDGVVASNKYFQWAQDFGWKGRWWDDDDFGPSGLTGYSGYLYRTRRRRPIPDPTTHMSIPPIKTIDVDETMLAEGGSEFIYPSQRSKRLADLTEAEWLAREEALAAEDEDWKKDKLTFYGHGD